MKPGLSPVGRGSLVVAQAWRLGLRGMGWSVALVVAIPAVFVIASFLVTSATSLSPRQERIKEFGVFDASAGYGVTQLPPGEDSVAARMGTAARSTHPQKVMTALNSVDFYVVGLTEPKARYEEHPWEPQPFPDRYRLSAGRYPSAPGEIAISGDDAVTVGQRVMVGTRTPLEVVGVVDDLYARQPQVLAAPGTWALLDPALSGEFDTMRAQPLVYWSGGDDRQVLDALSRVPVQSEAGEDSEGILESSYSTAPPSVGARATPWIDRVPIAYLVPAFLFPALTVALAFALSNARLVRLRRVGHGLGVPAYVTVLGHYLPVSVLLVAGAGVGGVVGVLVPHLARGPLESAAGRPVDLDVDVTGPLLQYIAAVAISAALVATGVVLAPVVGSRRGRSVPGEFDGIATEPSAAESGGVGGSRRPAWISVPNVRRLMALGLLCGGAVSSTSVSSPGSATTTATIVMLAGVFLIPDLLRFALAHLPASGWTVRLARARTRARFGASLATATTVALVVGITFGYLIVLQTWLTSAQGDRAPLVAQHELLVVNRSSDVFPPLPSTVTAARNALDGTSKQITVTSTLAFDREGQDAGAAAVEGSFKPLLVASSDDLAAIVGHQLTSAEQQVLDSGGVVLWHGSDITGDIGSTADRAVQILDAQREPTGKPVVLPTILSAVPPAQWRFSAVGVIEAATAQNLGLPTSDGAALFTGVTEQASKRINDAIQTSGIDPDTIHTYQRPEPLVPAVALPAVAVGLSVLMFFVSIATTWASARSNDTFLRTLIALGIAPNKARTTMWNQYAIVMGVAVTAGLVLAIIPIATVLLLLPGYQLSIPTTSLVALGTAAIIGCGASIAVATARLRAALQGLGAYA